MYKTLTQFKLTRNYLLNDANRRP